jgi:hypothetical protein
MSNKDVHYREAAVDCLELAKLTTDLQARQRLVILAAKLLDLANDPAQDPLLRRLIDEFNDSQMRK